MQEAPADLAPGTVLVVVPVFRDAEVTRNCLQSLHESELPAYVRVLVINDCSPDPDVTSLCRDLCARHNFTLRENDENLGFVRSVNIGFDLQQDADIILLNSDTVVSGNWVHRLRACAYSDNNIGTVTPFSNNGTICSYPVFLDSSALPGSWTNPELDGLFVRANEGIAEDIPTAVGFCMYIKRACLNMVGSFDAERFGQGYGEECDFSLRAISAGWRNVIAADVFVFHEGATSFADESQARKVKAESLLAEVHPTYQATVIDFVAKDPLAPLRRKVDLLRLAHKPEEGGDILDEQDRHHQRQNEHWAKLLEIKENELLEQQQQMQQMEVMLSECRAQFTQTDFALSQAQKMTAELRAEVSRLSENLQHVSDEVHAQGEELTYRQVHIDNLQTKIATMEQSRSWRYTAWLRREES